jgi:hypothetical protein
MVRLSYCALCVCTKGKGWGGVGRKMVRGERSVCVSGGDGLSEGVQGVKVKERERVGHTGTNKNI